MTLDKSRGEITPKGVEDRITSLLSSGEIAVDLVNQGYSRGTVYKMAKRLKSKGVDLKPVLHYENDSNASIEMDQDIVALKKKLRKTQLESEIASISIPQDLERRLKTIEERLDAPWEETEQGYVIEGLDTYLREVEEVLSNTPGVGLREEFRCKDCGQAGHVAIAIKCTACNKESYWGKCKHVGLLMYR